MASVKRDTNCPKRKEMLRRQKKNSQWMCPTTLLQMLAQPRRMSSIKFHSSTEARDSLHTSSCQNRRSYTVFLYHVDTVPLHRLEAWRQHVSTHGYTIMEQPVARDLFQRSCRNHACRTTAEQQQLTLLASCRVQHKSIGNYLPQTPKKIDFGSKLEAKNWSQKWSHFWLRLMKQ